MSIFDKKTKALLLIFRCIFHKLFTLNQCGPRLPRHFFEIGIQQETRHNLRIAEDSGHNRRHPNYQPNFMSYEFITSKQEQNVPHDRRVLDANQALFAGLEELTATHLKFKGLLEKINDYRQVQEVDQSVLT
jgi:hypothetical protein